MLLRNVFRPRLVFSPLLIAFAMLAGVRFVSHAQSGRVPLQARVLENNDQTAAAPTQQISNSTEQQIPSAPSSFVTPPTGQLWFATNGGGAGSQSVIAHVNNDNNNQTTVIDGTTFTGTSGASMSDMQLDPAANLYFFMKTNNLGVGAVLYAGHLNSSAVPTAVYTAPTVTPIENSDIVNAFQVNVLTHHVYIGYSDAGAAPTNSGIKDFTYDTTTGALTPVASNGGWLVRSDQQSGIPNDPGFGAPIFDPRDFALDTATNTLFFVIETDGGVYTNEIYRLNLSTPTTIVPLLQQSQFPVNNSTPYANGYLHTVTVDQSTGLVYFETNSQHPSPDATYNIATDKVYYIAETASGSTAATVVTLSGFSSTNFYPTFIDFDRGNRQLYVVDEKVDAGANPDNDDAMEVFQLDAPGHVATFQGQIQISPNFSVGNANNYTSMTYDVLPVLSSLGGTATHAVEQSTSITLLTGAPTITDIDGDHLAGATVKISGGTFVANETSANDDHLAVNHAVTSGKFTGTNITGNYDSPSETLTLSGYDTFANYQTILSQVQYNTTGDNPTNYGNNTTRTIQWIASDGAPNVPFGSQNSGSTTINIDAVNDAPVNNGVASKTGNEDTFIPITGLSMTDVDADPASAAQRITVHMTVSHGT
ncbi:MAG: hypothetical protein JO314_08115, partial [Acidobacteria bacterium]|nr:hypothetical protein [Acidobacteriota bacterium]